MATIQLHLYSRGVGFDVTQEKGDSMEDVLALFLELKALTEDVSGYESRPTKGSTDKNDRLSRMIAGRKVAEGRKA